MYVCMYVTKDRIKAKGVIKEQKERAESEEEEEKRATSAK